MESCLRRPGKLGSTVQSNGAALATYSAQTLELKTLWWLPLALVVAQALLKGFQGLQDPVSLISLTLSLPTLDSLNPNLQTSCTLFGMLECAVPACLPVFSHAVSLA